GAKLYRVSECPRVSGSHLGHSAPDRVSVCPTDSIESDTPDTPVLPLGGNASSDQYPDGEDGQNILKTLRDRYLDRSGRARGKSSRKASRTAATHNTARTRRKASEEDQ